MAINKTPIIIVIAILASFALCRGLLAEEPKAAPKDAPVLKTTDVVEEKVQVRMPMDHNIDLSGYLGMHTDPGNFALAAQADFHIAPYLSFGPLLQYGFWNSRSFFTGTLGGKFHFVPLQATMPELELSVQAGVGYFLRHANGFTFDNFVFTTGVGGDYFFKPQWAVSSLILINVNNDPVDEIFYSWLIGVKYVL